VFGSMQGTRSRILAAAAVTTAAVGLTACAASGGAPAAVPATTVTQTAQASPQPAASSPTAAPSAPASAPASGSAGAPAGSSAEAKLPDYDPSTVVSKSAYSTVLTSPDPVSRVGEFYRNALATGGWHVTSSSLSAYHASFTAYRSNEGVSVSVYSTGHGSGISISTHPQ
jgi:hypothetical protein